MFLVTGLGNPGKQYENTPHNAGFLFLDILHEYLADNPEYQVDDWSNESKLFYSEISKVRKGGEIVGLLQKPMTFVNLSGKAVSSAMSKFNITNLILVHDDLDIKLGDVKVVEGKSPKGHKGVLDVERGINSTDFLRVRVGVENRESMNISGEDYVLRKLSKDELDTLTASVVNSLEEVVSHLDI